MHFCTMRYALYIRWWGYFSFDEGDSGSGGVEVVGETTRLTVLGLLVMLHEAGRPALGAILELR